MAEETNQNNHTTTSLQMLKNKLDSKRKNGICRKILFGSFSAVSFLAVLLYFVLPVFYCANAEVQGEINFLATDILSLAGMNNVLPCCFLNCQKAQQQLMEQGCGLLLKASVETNGFHATVQIQEDYPMASFSDVVYFSSGLDLTAVCSSIQSLTVSENSREDLESKMKYQAQSSLPQVFLPSGCENTEGNRKAALAPITKISSSCLKWIVGIQYLNPSQDSSPCTVAQALVIFHDQYFLIDHLLSDHFSAYFPENIFAEQVLPNLEKASLNGKLKRQDFQFSSGEKNYSVYYCRAVLSDSGTVDFIDGGVEA